MNTPSTTQWSSDTGKTTIVIPTYNEADNIESLLDRIFSLHIPQCSVLIVDDNSPDGTAQKATTIAATNNYSAEILKRAGKLGLGSAYIAGFKHALEQGADRIFEMDADGSHSPDVLPKMIELSQTHDLVIGSRRVSGGNVTGWNTRRNLQSVAAASCARTLLGLHSHDVTAGFRCYRSEVLKKIPLNKIQSNGYAFQLEILWWVEKLGFSVKETPITFIDRQFGKSKLSHTEILKFFQTLFRLTFQKPTT